MTSKYIKSFSATLSKETEWERKYKMLQELETKLNEEEFVLTQEDVSCISLILCSQITDLRSTLMKQALNVTVLMVWILAYWYFYFNVAFSANYSQTV